MLALRVTSENETSEERVDVALRYVSSIEKLNGPDHFFSFEQHLLLSSPLSIYINENGLTRDKQVLSFVKPKRI